MTWNRRADPTSRLKSEISEAIARHEAAAGQGQVPFDREIVTDRHSTLRSTLEQLLNPRGYGMDDVVGLSVTLLGTRVLEIMDEQTYEILPAAVSSVLDMDASEIDGFMHSWGVGGVNFTATVWLDGCILTVGPQNLDDSCSRTVAAFIPTSAPASRMYHEPSDPRRP